MIEKYIEGRIFNRTKFAIDIKNSKITMDEISIIISEIDEKIAHEEIENPYLGVTSSYKIKKSAWNKPYLDHLLAEVSSSEVFNKDSIKYLCAVSEYVNKAGKRLFINILCCALVALFLFFSGYVFGKKKPSVTRGITIQQVQEFLEE